MSNETNPYYVLGKLIEKDVDSKKIKDFVEQYLKIAEKNGEKPDEVLMQIKNFSMELNESLMDICVKIQSNLPRAKHDDPTSDLVTVKEAAKIFNVTSATIRNWIKNKNYPLPANNFGKRQTRISTKALKDYIKMKPNTI